jgi:hypothetical protein
MVAHPYGGNPSPVNQHGRVVPPGSFFDQHGWSDPVVNRLYVKALRAGVEGSKAQISVLHTMLLRLVTQAEFLPVVSEDIETFLNAKKVVPFKRPQELAYQMVEWVPAK